MIDRRTTSRAAMRVGLAALLALAGAGDAAAQQEPGRDRVRDRVRERVEGARPMVDRMAEMVQRRLGLTDDQGRRLREATARYAAERQQMLRRERALRRELRDELSRGSGARQEHVGTLLDQLLGLQRQRVDLVAAEQRALSGFLTPVQRAEFLAMQERAMRAAQQMRQRREARGPGDGRRPVY